MQTFPSLFTSGKSLTLAGLVLRAVLSLTMLPLSAVAQQGYEVQGPYHASPMTPSHGAYAYQQQGYGQPGSWQGGPPPYEQQPVASLPRARQKSPPAYQQRPVQQPAQNAGNYNGNGQPYAYPSSVAAAPVPKAPSKSRSPEYGQMPKNNYTTNTYPRNNGNPNAVTPGKVNAYAAPQVVNDISDLKVNDRVQDRRLAELESRLSKGTNVPESSGYATHTVRSSDTLWRISDKYGTTPTQIKAANRLTNDVVTEGQTLIIPTKRASAMKSSHTAGNSAPPSGTHTVQQGETLSGIAASYGIPTSVLQSSNGISNANSIQLHQRLIIPGRGARKSSQPVPTNASKKLTPKKPAEPHFVSTPKAHVAAKTETVAFASPPTAPAQFNGSIAAPQGPRGITSYRIEQGDKSWENVARSFNTSAAEIRSLNMMTNSDLPAVGSEIIVPSPGPVSL